MKKKLLDEVYPFLEILQGWVTGVRIKHDKEPEEPRLGQHELHSPSPQGDLLGYLWIRGASMGQNETLLNSGARGNLLW